MSAFFANYPPIVVSGGGGGATAANQVLEIAQLTAINSNTVGLATQATLAALNAKVTAVDTGNVTVVASALPTGAATSAAQATGNASLSSIDGKTPALGQALAAASTPVVLPAAQITALTPPTTVTVTQATASALNATIVGTTAAGSGASAGLVTVQGNASATPIPVSGSITVASTTANQGTPNTTANAWPTKLTDGTNVAAVKAASTAAAAADPSAVVALSPNSPLPAGSNALGSVSVSASALPTGASTSALQTTGNTSLASIDTKTPALGQAVMASSVPVAIASNQGTLPVQSVDNTASGTITTQNLVPTGTATAGSAVAISVSGIGTVTIQVTGTYTGALSPQVTTDGATWVTQAAAVLQNMATGANSATIPSAAVGIYQIEVNGHAQFRLTALAAVTGTATITLRGAAGTSQVSISTLPLPTGAATAALQTTGNTSLASIDTKLTSPLTVTVGSALPTGANTIGAISNTSFGSKIAGLSAANAPVYNVYSSTNITTAAYVQLIAATTSAAQNIQIFDSSGQGMILAVGAPGSEVIQAYVAPGGDAFQLNIPAGSRVAYKALTANATAGYLLINLLG